ncbi:IS256 family transposase [Embleya sp. NPDC059237]|uniref:IS256 family transposase n=1 Tax=Embleya sp. NPDC059237 TaxID=3346784 RepID=UPI0036B67E81
MTDVAITTTGSTVVEGVSGTSGPATGQGVDTTLTAAVAELAEKAAERARAGGVRLLGEGGLLQALAKRLMEDALDAEMEEHLAAEQARTGGASARRGGNARNGTRRKTVNTEVGPVTLDIPRDRAGTFRPGLVPVHARRTGALDEMVISLTAKGLTGGEIVAHLAEVYDITTSKETVSTITDQVLGGMNEWRTRPLDAVYPVVFVDAIHVKIRDGQVANRPVYVALGVTVDGYRDILGLWIGDGGEGAKYWGQVLGELKNRGVKDCCVLVCDGLNGLPDAVASVWPATVVQTCIVHLLRNSFRYASRKDWAAISRDLKPVYTAATEAAAHERLAEFAATWETAYPAIVRLWERSWAEMVPFLAFDREIRTIICTTNAIESINARYRRAANASGHFPNEQAALKRLYLATLALDPTGKGRVRWSNKWKAALNAFDLAFDGRVTAGRT